MSKYLIYIVIVSAFLIGQYDISTKEYSFYKTNNVNEIDFSEIIEDINGNYIVELISFNDIDFKKSKRVLIETCDLKINISNLNSRIDISRCNNNMSYDNKLYISNDNYIANINTEKYKYVNGNFVFWVSGHFLSKTEELDKLNDGILREYHDDGSEYIEYTYNNGKKHGMQKRWYANGQLEIIYNYDYGKLDGLQKKWHSNGQLKGEWHYVDDKLHGVSKEWYPNKQLKFTKKYDMGVLMKVVNNYNPDGTVVQ